MTESSTLQSLVNYAAPQVRKRIPVTGTKLQTARAKYQQAFGQLASLRHRNVEAVHEVIFDPPKECYLLCERLEGDSLSELIARERQLPLEMVRTITRQIAAALTAAHHLGLMHGNLSPQSVLVQRLEPVQGEDSLRIKVCDFGLGRALAPELFGALGYLAPEQVDLKEPRPEPTPLSDQFALAVIVFEMLAGRRAFAGETLEEITPRLLRQDPIHFQIRGISQKESERVIAALHKALSRLPIDRYSTLNEFVIALEGRPGNNRSRGSVLDPSRFAAEHNAPLRLGASVAQALAGATQGLQGPINLVRPGQDAKTLQLVGPIHYAGSQAATIPMMPRLEVQLNLQTTVANQNDSHVNVILPPPLGVKPAAPAGPRMRRLALAALLGGVLTALLLAVAMSLGSMWHPRDQEKQAGESAAATPLKRTLPAPESSTSGPAPAPEAAAKPPRQQSSRSKRPKFALSCTPNTNKLGTALSRQINECSALAEGSRGSTLILPFSLKDGHPVLGNNDPPPQGPASLIQCLRDFVSRSNKAELGALPSTGIVLRCTIK